MPYTPSMAVNGGLTTFSRWLCNKVPGWMSVDFGAPYWINSWVVKQMGNSGWQAPDYNMCDFKLQGSNDNTNWTDIDVVANNTLSSYSKTFTPAFFRYARLYVTKGLRTNTQFASVMEFEVYQAPSALLTGLSISSGAISPAFAKTTFAYTAADVEYSTSSVTVTPTAEDPQASINVNGVAVISGQAASVPLNVGSNPISVVVTGAGGGPVNTYTITVVRKAGAVLSNLTVSSGTLTPSFASDTLVYTTGNVGYDTASITVTPTTNVAGTTITVNGTAVTSGQPATANLVVGSNTINVVATNGTATQTYTITLTRCSPFLTGLSISSGSFKETFSKNLYAYTANVANTVTSVTVTPISEDATATITVNTVTVASGTASAAISLNEGPNTITVIVTPKVGAAQSYTIVVTRLSIAVLSNLVLSYVGGGGDVLQFDPGINNYNIKVDRIVNFVKVNPSAATGTTITVNAASVASGATKPIPFPTTAPTTTITIIVTLGSSSNTYLVSVSRNS